MAPHWDWLFTDVLLRASLVVEDCTTDAADVTSLLFFYLGEERRQQVDTTQYCCDHQLDHLAPHQESWPQIATTQNQITRHGEVIALGQYWRTRRPHVIVSKCTKPGHGDQIT